jgi:hypothetical protein
MTGWWIAVGLALWIGMCTTGGQPAIPVDNCPIEVAQPVDILHPCKY